ncbi:tetraacyldisaccharide 4'-kinase [Pseudidiomarina sediminum]|uniref:tetraacyldisaccharide 4'-kinase n=1 Tax=Pseudidiomarina sediminum TaxID=431675 RepID=UPI001C97D770|nr:tetraacyldisaccharide 4'-kinase [Pseudidiomarina sediminum]MBY6062787.1 tetraacyldisaccharide 4'-kinase [Pseudidiomarina sediminum]
MSITKAWYRKTVVPWLWLFLPFHALFVAVSTWRRRRFLSHPPTPLSVPVIVVGNISVGGTGKTPVTLALIERLQALGHQPAIISRGYGGKGPFPLRVTATTPAQCCGDEPLLLAQRSGVPLVVAPDRNAAAAEVLRIAPKTTVIISDDGLQHYALARQFEIAVVDAARGVGNGWRLPIGPLREPVQRLASVDAIVVNGAPTPAELHGLSHVYAMQLQPQGWRRVSDDAPCAALPNGRTVAIAGIGHPERFFATVSQLESRDFDTQAFADHYAYSAQDADALGTYEVVLMTEKDAMKWRGLAAASKAYYLPVTAQLPAALIAQIADQLKPSDADE